MNKGAVLLVSYIGSQKGQILGGITVGHVAQETNVKHTAWVTTPDVT